MITSIQQLPITWVIADLVSFILFMCCIVHVIKSEKQVIPKIFMLFAFLIYSGIFENIGHAYGFHPYSPYRLLRTVNMGLGTSMMEVSLFYSAYVLVGNLQMPRLLKPFAIAFLASFADFAIDPVMHWDAYMIDGERHTQWIWSPAYADTFFGVPFYNFSGWIYFMLWFSISVYIAEWLYEKKYKSSKTFGYIYPWLLPISSIFLMILPSSQILLYGQFNDPPVDGAPMIRSERIPELIMLSIHCLIGLFIIVKYSKTIPSFNVKVDRIGFIIPMVFNMLYVIIGFARGLTEAYIPMIITTILHGLYLTYIYRQNSQNKA